MGMELWKSNGTATGTTMVKDIIPTGGSKPKKFIAMNGISYFIAFDGDTGPSFGKGEEVYQTNGMARRHPANNVDFYPGGELSERNNST
jgi:ELWxxDGT repeat protein